jgi:radical SAM superfamily enzyme with C-terminal helix-hairpin-helix motif
VNGYNSANIASKLRRPLIFEIESATGCNRKPGCTFCIENIRGLPNTSREVDDIVDEIKALYDKEIRYFRIGRQPNFFSFWNCSPTKVEELFLKIWSNCPNIKVLYIDNVSPHNVNTSAGKEITKIIAKYCTSANIASFGVESFDEAVRKKNNLNGTLNDIMESIRIINESGAVQDNMGTRRFLPGINIIYGLDGQTEGTLNENLQYMDKILAKYIVRRVFVRNLTSPHGLPFGENKNLQAFENWKQQIVSKFSLPMLKKVYPIGIIIKHERVEMIEGDNSILRQMGTCPERIVVKDTNLSLDNFYTIKITDYISDRIMKGEIICKE